MRGGMPLYHHADATYSAPCSDQYRWRCRAVVVDALHLYCFTRQSLLLHTTLPCINKKPRYLSQRQVAGNIYAMMQEKKSEQAEGHSVNG